MPEKMFPAKNSEFIQQLKIHAINFSSESDSSGQSDFDDLFYQYKPTPKEITKVFTIFPEKNSEFLKKYSNSTGAVAKKTSNNELGMNNKPKRKRIRKNKQKNNNFGNNIAKNNENGGNRVFINKKNRQFNKFPGDQNKNLNRPEKITTIASKEEKNTPQKMCPKFTKTTANSLNKIQNNNRQKTTIKKYPGEILLSPKFSSNFLPPPPLQNHPTALFEQKTLPPKSPLNKTPERNPFQNNMNQNSEASYSNNFQNLRKMYRDQFKRSFIPSAEPFSTVLRQKAPSAPLNNYNIPKLHLINNDQENNIVFKNPSERESANFKNPQNLVPFEEENINYLPQKCPLAAKPVDYIKEIQVFSLNQHILETIISTYDNDDVPVVQQPHIGAHLPVPNQADNSSTAPEEYSNEETCSCWNFLCL